MIFYKKENELIKHVVLTEQLESLSNQHFISNEYISNLRINRITGDKRQLVIYKAELVKNGYTQELPKHISLHPTLGLIANEGGILVSQVFLKCFLQKVSIRINSERYTNFQSKVFKYLLESKDECCQIIIDKIKSDYEGSKKGVIDWWEKDEIKDCFPPINNNQDVLNLLSNVELSIYDEESINHESSKGELIEIHANCPWDIEHGINLMIYKNEIGVTNKR